MLTLKKAQELCKVIDLGLCCGEGSKPGSMCVEQAVSYVIEGDRQRKPSDDPRCVSPLVARIKIRINDQDWSSKKARAKGLKRAALAQLGSNKIDEGIFANAYKDLMRRRLWSLVNALNFGQHWVSDEIRVPGSSMPALSACVETNNYILATWAECVVQALVISKSPGIKFLSLVPFKPKQTARIKEAYKKWKEERQSFGFIGN